MGYGAGNRLQLHEITAGSPDTISTTPDAVMDQTISSAWDKLLKLGAGLTLDQDKYDQDTTDFLIDAVPEVLPPDPTSAEKYENGTDSSQGTAASSYTGKRYVFGWYGGLNPAGTTRNIRLGPCYIAQESGAITTAWGTPTKPTFQLKGMKQAAGNAITIAVGFWNTGLVTPAGSPAAPTSIPAASYGVETWVAAP
jgi:hypothetical protein